MGEKVERREFKNNTQGYIGVVKINRKGDEEPEAVEPFGTVFLSDEEAQLTANAHRSPADNPFIEREIVHFDPMTHEPTEKFTAPILQLVEDARPTPRPIPGTQGKAMDGEETGVPTKKPTRRRSGATRKKAAAK